MLASYPISALLPGVNLNTTLLSHGNSLDFGLLADRHALPDLEQVVERILHYFVLLRDGVLGKKHAVAGGGASAKTKAKTKIKARTKSKTTAKASPVRRRTAESKTAR
jgi:hypothetical protein